jgi:hypothetical protein
VTPQWRAAFILSTALNLTFNPGVAQFEGFTSSSATNGMSHGNFQFFDGGG